VVPEPEEPDAMTAVELAWWIMHAFEAVLAVVPVYIGWKLGGRVVNWMFGEE
jgi:hypothetical protein